MVVHHQYQNRNDQNLIPEKEMAENWWGVQAKAWLHRPSFPAPPPLPFFGVIVCSFTEISISVEVKVKDSMFDLITSAGHSYFIGGANVLGHKMMVVVLFRSGGTVSPALLDFQSFLLCGLFKEFVSCFFFPPSPPLFSVGIVFLCMLRALTIFIVFVIQFLKPQLYFLHEKNRTCFKIKKKKN